MLSLRRPHENKYHCHCDARMEINTTVIASLSEAIWFCNKWGQIKLIRIVHLLARFLSPFYIAEHRYDFRIKRAVV